MGVTELFAGVSVRDRDAAVGFYERLLGAPPFMFPNDDEAAWQITDGGWLYVVVDTERAGTSLVTLLVDDFDERLAALAARGIVYGPVQRVEDTVRSTWIVDPDGNRIQVAHPRSGDQPT